METVLLRFPHLGQQIFNSLNNKSLQKSKRVSRSLHDFIDGQKFLWIRIIKKYARRSKGKYAKNSKLWKKAFSKVRTQTVKKLALYIHNDIHDFREQTLLHYALLYIHFKDKSVKNEL